VQSSILIIGVDNKETHHKGIVLQVAEKFSIVAILEVEVGGDGTNR